MNCLAELLPLFGFVFFGLFSPGPNVILITASGARFGLRRSLPHLFGIVVGVGITASITGFGVGALLAAQPVLEMVLKVIASGWIMWMAYRLWFANPASKRDRDRPFTFVEAVLFQWINPKVWAVALSATAYVAGMSAMRQGMTLGATFATLNFFVCTFWVTAGTLLAFLLTNALAWRIFMRVMAVALAGFSILVFL